MARTIRTEDGKQLAEGERAYNYYDMQPGTIGRMNTTAADPVTAATDTTTTGLEQYSFEVVPTGWPQIREPFNRWRVPSSCSKSNQGSDVPAVDAFEPFVLDVPGIGEGAHDRAARRAYFSAWSALGGLEPECFEVFEFQGDTRGRLVGPGGFVEAAEPAADGLRLWSVLYSYATWDKSYRGQKGVLVRATDETDALERIRQGTAGTGYGPCPSAQLVRCEVSRRDPEGRQS